MGLIHFVCPEMLVENTHRFNPFTPRRAVELLCHGYIFIDGVIYHFDLTFPSCLITKNKLREQLQLPSGQWYFPDWIVEAVTATGKFKTDKSKLLGGPAGDIWIKYGREGILRDGLNMNAQPVSGAGRFTLPNGKRGKIDAALPLAIGIPVGWGLRRFQVQQVEVDGTADYD